MSRGVDIVCLQAHWGCYYVYPDKTCAPCLRHDGLDGRGTGASHCIKHCCPTHDYPDPCIPEEPPAEETIESDPPHLKEDRGREKVKQ